MRRCARGWGWNHSRPVHGSTEWRADPTLTIVRLAVAGAILALSTLLFSSAAASNLAGPRYILVHGGGLPAQILLDDQASNELLVTAPDVEPRAGVPREADRPVYELALFFRVPDLTGRDPSDLQPAETSATGRFFPAVGELEAIFEVGAAAGIGPRRDGGLTPAMRDYLASRGVPVVSNAVLGPEEPTPTPQAPGSATEEDDGGSGSGWLWWLAGGAAFIVVGSGFLWFRQRRSAGSRPRGVHF